MSAEQQFTISSVHHFDDDAPIAVDVPRGSSLEAELVKRRAGLSTDRTGLHKKRTAFSALRSLLSNPRTHLSYLCTVIALIGSGIALNRFVVYLIDKQPLAGSAPLQNTQWVGLGMVALGAVMLVLGIALLAWTIYRYQHTVRGSERHQYHSNWRAMLAATMLFLVFSTITTIWLFLG